MRALDSLAHLVGWVALRHPDLDLLKPAQDAMTELRAALSLLRAELEAGGEASKFAIRRKDGLFWEPLLYDTRELPERTVSRLVDSDSWEVVELAPVAALSPTLNEQGSDGGGKGVDRG